MGAVKRCRYQGLYGCFERGGAPNPACDTPSPNVNCSPIPNPAYSSQSRGPPRGKSIGPDKGSSNDTYEFGSCGRFDIGGLWRWVAVCGRWRAGGEVCVGADPEGLSGAGAQVGVAGKMRLCAGSGKSAVVSKLPAARGWFFQEPTWLAASSAEPVQQCKQ